MTHDGIAYVCMDDRMVRLHGGHSFHALINFYKLLFLSAKSKIKVVCPIWHTHIIIV